MKSNELMIGDWVCYKGRIQIPARVLSFNNRMIKFDNGTPQDWMSTVENFEPIPLTDEILEKNRFERVDGQHQDVFYIYDDIELLIGNCYTLFGHTEMPIKYVHELQHALRLCKIDKEIIVKNFQKGE